MALNESNQQRCKIIVFSNKAIDTIVIDLLEYILIILSLFFIVSNDIVRNFIVGQRSKLLEYQHQLALLILFVHLTFKVVRFPVKKLKY